MKKPGQRVLVFGIWVGTLLVSTTSTWRTLLAAVSQFEHLSHILLIPVISAALLYLERRAVFRDAEWALGRGIPLAALGLTLHLISMRWAAVFRVDDGLSISVFGLLTVCQGAVLGCFGTRVFRAGLFSWLFLYLMVPVPSVLLESVTAFLLWGSTELTDVLFSISGATVFRQGSVFHLPGLSIEVAKECSGIRSSIALLVLSLLAGHLFLKSPARKTILVLVTLPILVLKNAIRITTLTLLAIHVDSGFLTGRLHSAGGAVFFGVGLLVLWPILGILIRGDQKDSSRDESGTSSGAAAPPVAT